MSPVTIARVLRPGGRFVAAVWAGPKDCDIVWFQQTAGSFAPAPPIAGVTTAALPLERGEEAKSAVSRSMWPNGEGLRRFRNLTQLIVGTLQRASDRC